MWSFGGIEAEGQTYPLAGARATVELGAGRERTTATRVVLGAVVAGGAGVVVGTVAKKRTAQVWLTIDIADGRQLVVEAPEKLEAEARKYAAELTSAGAS